MNVVNIGLSYVLTTMCNSYSYGKPSPYVPHSRRLAKPATSTLFALISLVNLNCDCL